MFNVTVNKHRQQLSLSQQMFTITVARSNTHLKSFAPLIDCSVYPALFQLGPHCQDTLLQLVYILNRLLVDSALRHILAKCCDQEDWGQDYSVAIKKVGWIRVVAPPGFCNRREVRCGSIGGLEYEVPQSRLYCLCINVALCSTALQCICRVIQRSSMTMKAHTYYIIFGRLPIGESFPFPPGGATEFGCLLWQSCSRHSDAEILLQHELLL